jgi:hypothetical protein
MNTRVDRKEAIRKYKERKTARGVFAMRCTVTGQAWVGASLNLGATKNGLWYMLNQGLYNDRALQDEWKRHGAKAFQYEVVETLDQSVLPLEMSDLLKEKKLHWMAQFGALAL